MVAAEYRSGSSQEVRISRLLSQILRHKALEYHIRIQPDGFCFVQELLACPPLRCLKTTLEHVQQIVATDDKNRFELKGQGRRMMIRAVQGHSIKVVEDNALLQPIDPNNLPECCVHGTYWNNFENIKKNGLLAGGRRGRTYRNHVHFACFSQGDSCVMSGMRSDCQIGIFLDVKKAIDHGVPLYFSANGVLLTPGVDGIVEPKFLLHAVDLSTNEVLPLH
eukprot:Skav232918  [mRNA]  locus=scaffold1477:747872:748534:- [translate_table: standard]